MIQIFLTVFPLQEKSLKKKKAYQKLLSWFENKFVQIIFGWSSPYSYLSKTWLSVDGLFMGKLLKKIFSKTTGQIKNSSAFFGPIGALLPRIVQSM